MDILGNLKKLIEIESFCNDSCNESQVAKYIYNELAANQIVRIESQEVEEGRYNLFASTSMKNEDIKVLFLGHMDTVLPSKENMMYSEDSEYIYGLGSVDMKAGLSIMLGLASKFATTPGIAFLFTVDEEYNFKGVKQFINESNPLLQNLSPKWIVNMEPTDMKVINGWRGCYELDLTIKGNSAHAARKRLGKNAIIGGVDFADFLEQELLESDNFAKTSVNLAYLEGGSLQNGKIVCSPNKVPDIANVLIEIRSGRSEGPMSLIQGILDKYNDETGYFVILNNSPLKVDGSFVPQEELMPFTNILREYCLDFEFTDPNECGFMEVGILANKINGNNSKCNFIVFGPSDSGSSHTAYEKVSKNDIIKTYNVMEEFLKRTLTEAITSKASVHHHP